MSGSNPRKEAKVEIINDMDKKVEISYPCEWRYKVIGESCDKIEEAVREIFGDRTHTCTPSKSSAKGRYHSYDIKTLVHSDDDRTALFELLKNHRDLKMVL